MASETCHINRKRTMTMSRQGIVEKQTVVTKTSRYKMVTKGNVKDSGNRAGLRNKDVPTSLIGR